MTIKAFVCLVETRVLQKTFAGSKEEAEMVTGVLCVHQ